MSEPIKATENIAHAYDAVEREWTYEELLDLFHDDSNVVRPLVLRCQSLEAENARLAALVQGIASERDRLRKEARIIRGLKGGVSFDAAGLLDDEADRLAALLAAIGEPTP